MKFTYLLLLATIMLSLNSCGSDKEKTQFSFDYDGTVYEFEGKLEFISSNLLGIQAFTATKDGTELSFTIIDYTGEGTYTDSDGVSVTLMVEGSASLWAIDMTTLTVTEDSDDKIVASFDFTDYDSNGQNPLEVNGSFTYVK